MVYLHFNIYFMEEQIVKLFESYRKTSDYRIEPLPLSGSSRKYYRIQDGEKSYVGVYHENLRENRLFVEFTNHFRSKGLHVPEIYVVSGEKTSYLQEDLGREMLLDVVEREREGSELSDHTIELYKKALKELLRFQVIGHEGVDYTNCLPRPVFDERCIRWDLNYFKYCFLRLAGVDADEDKLENDFDQLVEVLQKADTNYFMFRDFQSRNIMVLNEEVYFIDYQGGRRGALHYDVASLLYDAVVKMPDVRKEELLEYYIGELANYNRERLPVSGSCIILLCWYVYCKPWELLGCGDCTRGNRISLILLSRDYRESFICSRTENWERIIPRFNELSEWLLKNTLYLCVLK